MIQAYLGVFSVLAVWFSQCQTDRWRRWACICGLMAQPGWLWETWQAQQVGMFALCFVYSALWLRGFFIFWWPKNAA